MDGASKKMLEARDRLYKNLNMTCPVCGEGRLRERVVQETTEYKGQTGETPLHFSECDVCALHFEKK